MGFIPPKPPELNLEVNRSEDIQWREQGKHREAVRPLYKGSTYEGKKTETKGLIAPKRGRVFLFLIHHKYIYL